MAKTLPLDITQILFAFIEDKISLRELEQWVYQENRLELIINADDYLKLIALDFRNPKRDSYWHNEIKKTVVAIIDSYANIAEYENNKLKSLLNNFLQREGNLASLLSQFYDYYCLGYGFLQVIGIDYGLDIACYLSELEFNSSNFFPKSYTKEDIAEEIQAQIKHKLTQIDIEVKKVLSWLESGQIEIAIDKSRDSEEYYYGELHGLYYLDYIDRRK